MNVSNYLICKGCDNVIAITEKQDKPCCPDMNYVELDKVIDLPIFRKEDNQSFEKLFTCEGKKYNVVLTRDNIIYKFGGQSIMINNCENMVIFVKTNLGGPVEKKLEIGFIINIFEFDIRMRYICYYPCNWTELFEHIGRAYNLPYCKNL